jgi:hypothetical protein
MFVEATSTLEARGGIAYGSERRSVAVGRSREARLSPADKASPVSPRSGENTLLGSVECE